jgi:hypothetical protein
MWSLQITIIETVRGWRVGKDKNERMVIRSYVEEQKMVIGERKVNGDRPSYALITTHYTLGSRNPQRMTHCLSVPATLARNVR